MATIAQIQNILEKAIEGQVVSITCAKNSTNVKADVVSTDPEHFGHIAAEQWYEGWKPQGEVVDDPRLCFIAKEVGSTISIHERSYLHDYAFIKSFDGISWSDYDTHKTITLNNVNDKVYITAKSSNDNMWMSEDHNINFIMTGKIAVTGDVIYLINKDGIIDY